MPIIHAQTKNPITQNTAWGIVEEILGEDIDSVNVFVSCSKLIPNKTISTWNGDEVAPEFESWFFFIDDMPFCNWTHPCRYVFVNTNDGKATVFYKRRPPLNIEMKPLKQKRINSGHNLLNFPGLQSYKSKESNSTRSSHQYAIIISGGGNAYSNYERYWNDCSAIYQTLVNVYGYSKQNIYVLMADGTNPAFDRHLNNGTYESSPLDLDGDGLADIQYDATRSSIANVFNILSNTLTEEDDLFIFTTDHGDIINGNHVVMCLWNGESLHDYEFATYLNTISANQINICMGQCYSGGFIDNISNDNIVISTACRYDEMSYARLDYLYDEYVYHWISAVAGETPSGNLVNADINNDGIVSMKEAFEYANSNDIANEHPQYMSNPAILGLYSDITGYSLLHISGPTVPCVSNDYYVNIVPNGYTVEWSLAPSSTNLVIEDNPPTIYGPGPNTNQCSVMKEIGYYAKGTLIAKLKENGIVKATLTKVLDTGANLSATWSQGLTSNTLLSGQSYPIQGGSTVYLQSDDFVGATVSYSSTMLLLGGVSHNNGTISFLPPTIPLPRDMNSQHPQLNNSVVITVTKSGTCEAYQFTFYLEGYTPFNDSDAMLNVNQTGNEYTFTIKQSEDGTSTGRSASDNSPWQLEIVRYDTGQSVYKSQTGNTSINVNTAGWTSGVYVAVATKNGQKMTKKLFIQ